VDVFVAVALGEPDTLRAIVRATPDALDARLGFVDDDCTPLQLAAARGQLEVATTLLDLGADVATRSMRGVTALAFALQRGHAAVADALLARGAGYDLSAAIVTGDLDRASADPDAPLAALLFAAVESGRERAVRWLLDHGAGPDETLRSLLGERPANVTPLQRAAELGQVSCAGALLEHGADPNAGLAAGLPSPLHLAAGCGALELVRLLLQHGADRTVTESFYGATPAGWAAFAGHDPIVELLAGS
jgi:ankyrin repeat protein